MASYIDNGRINIRYKKKRNLVFAVSAGFLALVCLAVGILVDPEVMEEYALENLDSKTALVFGALFFGAGAAFFAKRAKDGIMLITADRSGITENSTPYSLGELILWKNINGISLEENDGKMFIAVELSNIDSYIGKLSNYKRKLFDENTAKGYRYVTITAAGSRVSLEELYTDLMVLWRRSEGIDSGTED